MSDKSPLSLPESLSGVEPRGLFVGEPVAQFGLGDYRNFVYLILDWKSRKAAWIDPQVDLDPPLMALEAHGFTLDAILLTHTHFDHVAGLEGLVERFPGIRAKTHSLDLPRLKSKGPKTFSACDAIEDGDTIPVGGLSVVAIHTPGHSAGELCYRLEATDLKGELRTYLFTGDTLFIRDCGRTDLETGSNAQMFESLQRLKKFPPDTVILPGHHYVRECASTLSREMETSPPLRCASIQELEALP